MINGSLDAECMIYLTTLEVDDYDSLTECNAVVETMTDFLKKTWGPWPSYFKFKGKSLEGENDLDLIALYYVKLAKAEDELKRITALPSMSSLDVDVENMDEEERKSVLAAFGEAISSPPLRRVPSMLSKMKSTVREFKEGNSAEDLMYNYGVCVVKRVLASQAIICSVGFPDFYSYHDTVDEYVGSAKQFILEAQTELTQRKEVLLLRLRHDYLFKKIRTLETI